MGRKPANIIAEALAADEDVLVPKGHLNHLARSFKVIKEAVKDAKDKLKAGSYTHLTLPTTPYV